MTVARILGRSDVRIWGLDSEQRLTRQVQALGGVDLGREPESGEQVLLLRADHAYELRILQALQTCDGVLTHAGQPVAAAVGADLEAEVTAYILGNRKTPPDGCETRDAASLTVFQDDLRRATAPLVRALTQADAQELESLLYGASYKGITDFVTKWFWPRPAKVAVRLCANWRLSPNLVTGIGAVLVLAATWLFWLGAWLPGLLAAWLMTFLDTVDGKLARVTIQSSRFGHILDHGMDVLHPPFWYALWGLALADSELAAVSLGLSFSQLLWFIGAGYVGGRLIEGLFLTLARIDMFAWRPFDAWFRLVTARRNPCLVLLTLAWLIGAPALGFVLVALWTLASSLVLLARLLQAGLARWRGGRNALGSWLGAADAHSRWPRSFRTFATTRAAYAA